MIELAYKDNVANALGCYGWHVQAHEDKQENFIPDLSFANAGVEGWIEVKYASRVPPKLSSIEHWTQGQEDWLRKRGRTGTGHCYLLVGTPTMHVLWRWACLDMVRELDWAKAIKFAHMKEYELPLLLERMNREIRRR